MGKDIVSMHAAYDRYNKNRKSERIKIVLLYFFMLVVTVAIVVFLLYETHLVYKVCHVEAGVQVNASDFLTRENMEAYFTEDSDPIDVSVPGEYQVKIRAGLFAHASTLYVEDTTAPIVSVQPVKIETGETCKVTDFVKSIEDATATEAVFLQEPDYNMEGIQKVVILVTDAGGNQTEAETELTIYRIVSSIDVEIGSQPPDASAFGSIGSGARITTDMSKIDFSKLGTHAINIKANGKDYKAKINIVDTEAPVLEVKNITTYAHISKSAEEFVTRGEDATALTYSFTSEPDFTKTGTQSVGIMATDEGGNRTVQKAELTLLKDTSPPQIFGASDINIYLGENVSYRANVYARDDCPVGLALSVDSSRVNINAPGSYPVTYTASDLAGNKTSVTIHITIRERQYTDEEINFLADQVLAKIIRDDMSQRDKAAAIFNYLQGHIRFVSGMGKCNWRKAAFEGLANGRGNCYVYACAARALLTRVGIPNMDIERIPSETGIIHCWNLVDIGDGHGWYHFDATPWSTHVTIFLWTDKKLKEYSDENKDSHNYDRSLYPKIK